MRKRRASTSPVTKVDKRGLPTMDWTTANAQIEENVMMGLDMIILGPCGSGKTTAALRVAERMGRPLEVFHLGGMSDAEGSLKGSMVLRSGETVFVPSRFSLAVATPDCVLVLDELNRAPLAVHNMTMSLMDCNARLDLEQEEQGRQILERAPGVVILATANHGGEYHGTDPLDMALLDRLTYIRVGYPENEEEILLQQGVKPAQARRLMALAHAVREQAANGGLPASISTRRLICAARLVVRGHSPEEAVERNVAVLDGPGFAALRTTLQATP